MLCVLWQRISPSAAVVSPSQSQRQRAGPAARGLLTQGPASGKETLHGALLSSGAEAGKSTGELQRLSGISSGYKSGTASSCHWLNVCRPVAEHLSSYTREELCVCNYLSDESIRNPVL